MGAYSAPVVNSLNTPSVTQDVIANRPAAGIYGRWFHSTDGNILYWDNGAAWVAMTGGGGGNVTTAGGTPPYLPKWDTATDLDDSLLYQQLFAGIASIWSDNPIVLQNALAFFAKLLDNNSPSQTTQIVRDVANAINIFEQIVLKPVITYTQLINNYRIPDVLFWNQVAGATITLQSNNGAGAHVAIKDELQTVGDILGGADVSATNDLLANGNLVVGGTVETGDPGPGAATMQFGKFTAGVAPGTTPGYITLKVDGVKTYVNVKQ